MMRRLISVSVLVAVLLSLTPVGPSASKDLGKPPRVSQSLDQRSWLAGLQSYAALGNWLISKLPGRAKREPEMTVAPPVTAYINPPMFFINAPTNLTVTSTSDTQVVLSWTAPAGSVDHYQVERSQTVSGPFVFLSNAAGTGYTDGTMTTDHAYLYRVRAVATGNVVSLPSNMALGTATSFEFSSLQGQLIKAQHFYDVRTAVNAVRAAANLSAATWSRQSLAGLFVQANDVQEMRNKLDEALTALSIPVTAYQDPTLSTGANGTIIQAIHLEQLQARSTKGSSTSSGPLDADYSTARVDPLNATGGGGENPLSRNFNFNLPLVKLAGRGGMDLGLTLSYNSLVWTMIGNNTIAFDKDIGFPGAGFRLGFPVIEPSYFDTAAGKDVYLLIGIDGSRTELRQVTGSTTLYEAADSSHLLFDTSSMILRSTDGTQLTYSAQGGEYKCTQIKDRNGNYISVSYTQAGQINTITDTLGRVLTFEYTSGLLTAIKQTWNQSSPSPVTHYWARFEYAGVPIDFNFGNMAVLGLTDNSTPQMLSRVKFADNSYVNFSYTSWGQVWKVSTYAVDNHLLNYRFYNLPQTADPLVPFADCPRFTERHDWAQYWNGDTDGTPVTNEEALTQFAIPVSDSWTMPDNTAQSGTRAQVTLPDGTSNKIYFIGTAGTSSGWRRGLTALVNTYDSSAALQRQAMTTWTQDNTAVSYQLNPRITETNMYDPAGNRARVEMTYQQFTFTNGTSCQLPIDTYEYAADATTKLRSTRTDYNTSTSYSDRRILGVVSETRIYEGDVNNGGTLKSKVGFNYDETGSIQGTDAPVQHDNTNYSASFVIGRRNLSSIKRYNVNNIAQFTTMTSKYNTAGSIVSTKDALNHEVSRGYGDSFSDGVSRNTFAYETTINDPDNYSSTLKYNFDFGYITRRQTPATNVTTNTPGPEQSYTYDDLGRLERVTNLVNNGYRRFVYFDNQTRFDTYTTIQDGLGEVQSINMLDGVGRSIGMASSFPGSAGGFRGQMVAYDVMGRMSKTSKPTETSAIGLLSQWQATGDDGTWAYAQQSYDWKGRPLVSTNTDGTTKLASYTGCGCAGGEVTTLQDEGTMISGVLTRRIERIRKDVLGRSVRNEILEWDGTTVESTLVNVYDALDRVVAQRRYSGTAPADAESPAASCPTGTCLQTTLTYDGYGRLRTRHHPEQQVDPTNAASTDHTTWDYRDDDTIDKITDARGAVTNYSYNNRHLVTGISYTLLPGVPTSGPSAIQATPSASFSYDAAGNRTLMTDGAGYVSYAYDQLSRLTSETRYFNLSTRSYTLTYGYNLVNDVMSVSDSRGGTVQYSRDQAAQLQGITGTGTVIPTYATSFGYRAWGGLKHITYGNNMTYDLGYDQRMKPSSFVVTGANPTYTGGPTTIMNSTFQYYGDGRIKAASDLVDNKFDRAYSYDNAGRLENSFTNQQARDLLAGQTPSPTDQGPYRESFTYDFNGNVTQRLSRYWSQPSETANFTFDGASSRVVDQTLQYDAEGHVVTSDGTPYKYDVAGQLVGVGIYNYSLVRDGDGRVVQRVEREDVGKDFRRHYDVHSSVLSGHTVLEDVRMTVYSGETIIFASWDAYRFVYADKDLIAKEHVDQFQYAMWVHQNPVTGSIRDTNSYTVPTGEFPGELDASGVNVGLEDPAANQPPPDDAGAPAVRDFELGQQCAINGITFDCSTPLLNKAGSFGECPFDDCGARWNPNVNNGRGSKGAWEFFHVLDNGFSGWMTPYGFSHYDGDSASFFNSKYEDDNEIRTHLSRTSEFEDTPTVTTGGTGPATLQNHVDGVCSLMVSFNGPGFLKTDGPGLFGDSYGLGFTVLGSVAHGAIGKVEVTPTQTDTVNANGSWVIQQWESDSYKLTRDIKYTQLFWGGTPAHADGPYSPFRQVENQSFIYADFPGPKRQTADGKLTYAEAEFDFDIKLVNGSQQCEVKFHISMALRNGSFTANWRGVP